MPEGLMWRHIAGMGILAGIGFTVALFISELAFHGTDPTDQANAGILVASLCAGLAGLGTLWWVGAAKR
jgi:NhaA family Na+:H+ antiporter